LITSYIIIYLPSSVYPFQTRQVNSRFILSFTCSPAVFESCPIQEHQTVIASSGFIGFFDFVTHSLTLTPLGHALELSLNFSCSNRLRNWVV